MANKWFINSIVVISLFFAVFIIQGAFGNLSVLDKGIFPLEKGSIGIQFYLDVENNQRNKSCKTHARPKMCCSTDENYKDCDSNSIYGDTVTNIPPKERDTFVFVYPSLFQYDQIGFCDFVVDYKCRGSYKYKNLMVNVPFDTRLDSKKSTQFLKSYNDRTKRKCDSIDQDVFNDCLPVDCDLKYSGRRSFYDVSLNKCTVVPICTGIYDNELPDIAYDPKGNICRDLDHPITVSDIYGINAGLGIITETPKDMYTIKVKVKSNCTTISQNLMLLKDMLYGKLCPLPNGEIGDFSDYEKCCNKAMLSICFCIFTMCFFLFLCIFCVQVLVWFVKKWAKGDLKNPYRNFKNKADKTSSGPKPSRINREVTNDLLKDVIKTNLPLQLRESVVDICDRVGQEIKQKKRYRLKDIGSQINLCESEDSTTSTSFSDNEFEDKNY